MAISVLLAEVSGGRVRGRPRLAEGVTSTSEESHPVTDPSFILPLLLRKAVDETGDSLS